jgi:hypothetical protein
MIATMSQERLWSQVIARTWSDEDFKERFMIDPRGVLAEHGIELPDDADIKVVQDTDTLRHLVLPAAPTDELTDEDLVGSEVAYCWCGDCGRCGCGCVRCRCACD